ncbi:MAG: DUF1573 domain-containing protein, partial [Bacteroidia bacterium]|nr:DUF1573 domain-containing protein [Bacteroidia bacterium]
FIFPLILSVTLFGSVFAKTVTYFDISEVPILPGEKGVITAKVDTEKFRSNSEISKYVTVLANTEPNRVTLKIKGKIK